MVGGEFKVCGWGSDDDNDSMMNNFDGYRRRGLSLKIAYIFYTVLHWPINY